MGGVTLTMATIKGNCWIPKLQQIAERIIRRCFLSKRLYTEPSTTQQQIILPSDRTTGIRLCQVIGTAFADPIMYCNKNRGEKQRAKANHLE